jgi:molybdenum cofactor cytidylyltransferase
MGVPKLSLDFRLGVSELSGGYFTGVSFLEQCISQFLLFGCSKVVVVVNSEGLQWIHKHKPAIKKKARLVLNPDPERGRLSSLQLGIQKAGNWSRLFIHNVDNPFVSQKVLHSIREASDENIDFDYISPRYKGQGGHPIMVSKRVIRPIIEAPSHENLKQVLSAYARTNVEVHDPNILVNINTIEEYQDAGLPLGEKTCPVCRRSDEVVSVIYGMPSHELFLEAERGLVRLGGCCVSDENPQWYCRLDDLEF